MSLFYFDDGKENSISTKENELLYSVCQETHSMLFWRSLYNTKPLKALTQFFLNTKRFTLLTFFLRINKVYIRFDRKTFCKPITRKYAREVVNQHCIVAMTEHKTSYYIIRLQDMYVTYIGHTVLHRNCHMFTGIQNYDAVSGRLPPLHSFVFL